MTSFAKSTATVTAFTLLGIFLGFLSSLVIAAKFGVSSEMDAYVAATTLPNLLTLILTLSLSAAFLPVLSKYRHADPAEAWRIVNTFMNIIALGSLGISLVTMFLASPITAILTPGLTPEQTAFSAILLRWLLPCVMLGSISQLISSVYHANGKFLVPALTRVFPPFFTVGYAHFLGDAVGVKSLAVATLSAYAAQTLFLLHGLLREKGFKFRLDLNYRHPEIQTIARLMLPMALGMCFYKLTPAIQRWIASDMPTGSIATLGYATRLIGVLQPMLVSGISASGFALMSEFATSGKHHAFRMTMTRSCNFLLFASVPLALFLCVFGKPLIALVYERGAFTLENTLTTYAIFSIYALALPVTTVGTVIGQAFHAFQDTRTPALFGILDILLFTSLCVTLAPHLGLIALPVSFNLSFYASTIGISIVLSRKTGYSVPRLFLQPLATGIAASALALCIGLPLRQLASASNAWGVACLGVSLVAYFIIQRFVFRNSEADKILRLVLGKARLPDAT